MAQTTIQGSFLGDATVTGAKIGADFISAQTALTTGLATTDEIIVSDAGVIKRMDISVIEIAASQITASGTLPALNGAALTALTAANITASGTLPALNGAALTALTAANITASGTLPALNGAALTALVAGNITSGGTFLAQNGSALTALNGTQVTSGTLPAARIAADSIVEEKLDVSNGPTNGLFLQAQSGEGGGLTWAAAGADISARVTHSANQSIANNTILNIAFDTEQFDTDGIHDNSTNNARLTCKTAGLYLIIGWIHWQGNATGRRNSIIQLNGTTSLAEAQVDGTHSTENFHLPIMVIANLAVDDYVVLQGRQVSGGAIYALGSSIHQTSFSMVKVG